MALLEGAEAAIYILGMVNKVLGDNNITITCITDNKSLCNALESSKQVEDKRLRIDLATMEDYMKRSEIDKVCWVAGSDQLADVLTKKGVSTDKLRAALCRYNDG